ncbi:MAG TPA: hypothetical protein VKM72_16210 [Thermoanaerobaculia bacterium]|nr:hypothetical protein [Thermoanaerobaculia bacterium]
MPVVTIKEIIKFLTGKELVQCTERFKLSNVNVMSNKRQLFATAQLEAIGNEDISGAMIYLFDLGADLETSRFCAGIFGPAMGMNDTTTFKLPLTMSTSLFPFEMKEMMKIRVIVVVSSPGKGECYLDAEVSVTPSR